LFHFDLEVPAIMRSRAGDDIPEKETIVEFNADGSEYRNLFTGIHYESLALHTLKSARQAARRLTGVGGWDYDNGRFTLIVERSTHTDRIGENQSNFSEF
jgi:hypothetical protein